MTLLIAANRKALPPLRSTETMIDPFVVVKFFAPIGAPTWYAMEFDGNDTFYGLCDLGLGFPELGYFSLHELTHAVLPLGLKIERDRAFTPQRLSNVFAASQA